MTSVFSFFKELADKEFEAEFKAVYQQPGVTYIQGAWAAVGGLVFLSYYFIAALNGALPYFGGAQTMRLVVCATLLIGIVAMLRYRAVVTQHYTLTMNVLAFAALAGC